MIKRVAKNYGSVKTSEMVIVVRASLEQEHASMLNSEGGNKALGILKRIQELNSLCY